MDITIRIEAGDVSAELSMLRKWLLDSEELRGTVRTVAVAPKPGELGALADTLIVAVGAGGVATVAVRALSTTAIAWLQRRTGEVTMTFTKPDGSTLEYRATNVRDLTLPEIDSTAKELANKLTPPPDAD